MRARLLNPAVSRSRRAAKDHFLRYVFHEVRVPLSTATLAVDELCAAASPAGPSASPEAKRLPASSADQAELLLLASAQVALLRGCNHFRVLNTRGARQLDTAARIVNDTLFIARLEVRAAALRVSTPPGMLHVC